MELDLCTLFTKVARECDLDSFTLVYCLRRLKSEGVKFLTVTLPKLSKAVLRSLELGYFDRTGLTCFAWKGRALCHFRVILKKIFDLGTGLVLDQPDALAIYRLRQLCDYFYKLALPYSDEDYDVHTAAFIATERQLSAPFDNQVVERVRKDFEYNFPEVAYADMCDVFNDGTPRPGPGTYCILDKFPQPWYWRKYYDDTCHESASAQSGSFRYLRSAPVPSSSNAPRVSQVLFVPKDSRGPRTITREGFSLLKGQMAFFDWITPRLEARWGIRFQDQQPNRRAAMSSSVSRDYATVDLKEASDRVRFDVAMRVFRNCPAIRWFLLNHRSEYTLLPDGSYHKLLKVAGMGSGLTFPLMSLLIYLVAVRTVADYYHVTFRHASKSVQVYGDDLIVPSLCLPVVVTRLHSIGLLVNTEKTFVNSHFRESCGGDYFNGQDVTPVRLKLANCKLERRGTSISIEGDQTFVALERHCRELVKAGLLSAADYIYSKLGKYIPLPKVCGESPVLGRYSLNESDVRSQFQENSTGEYVGIRACYPIPRNDMKASMDHYHVLGASLKRSSYNGWAGLIFPKESGVPVVSIPRRVAYRWGKVSPMMLLG